MSEPAQPAEPAESAHPAEPAESTQPEEPAEPAQPTAEQLAERARRADRATRGGLAGILGLEAVVVLLVPRAIAFTTGLGTTRVVLLVGLAVLMVAAAAVQRRPWGIGFGSALQVLFLATGIFIATMFLIGAIFALIWWRLLALRHELVGTPGGWRMLTS
jgi:hypothetical protein